MTIQLANLDLDLLKLIPPDGYRTKIVEKYHQEYLNASPYPHICLDNFLPEPVAEAVLDVFPDPKAIPWKKFENEQEVKLASEKEEHIPAPVRNVLYALNSATFLKFLEGLTGIVGLIPDPQFIGGGMHQIVPGGKLGIHVDFNQHPHFRLDRRLNLLIYFNQDWREEYNGQFELWDTTGTKCMKKILPLFNRCVIFSTTEVSYHGNPVPVQCPPGQTRKSLALYYYSNGRPEAEMGRKHSTIFLNTSVETSFLGAVAQKSKTIAREILPPVLFRLRRRN